MILYIFKDIVFKNNVSNRFFIIPKFAPSIQLRLCERLILLKYFLRTLNEKGNFTYSQANEK
jgi:hypothetical protein